MAYSMTDTIRHETTTTSSQASGDGIARGSLKTWTS